MLKENGYQESVISKIFKNITNNRSLSQSQQQRQAADISKEVWDSTLPKLLCKPKDLVATKDQNDIVFKNDCGSCKVAYFGEIKPPLKSRSDEPKDLQSQLFARINFQNIAGKQIINFAGIRRTLLIGKAGQFLGRWKKSYILWRNVITLIKFHMR